MDVSRISKIVDPAQFNSARFRKQEQAEQLQKEAERNPTHGDSLTLTEEVRKISREKLVASTRNAQESKAAEHEEPHGKEVRRKRKR